MIVLYIEKDIKLKPTFEELVRTSIHKQFEGHKTIL